MKKINQENIKIYKGCGHLDIFPVEEKYLACCPDSNYILLSEFFMDSVYKKKEAECVKYGQKMTEIIKIAYKKYTK